MDYRIIIQDKEEFDIIKNYLIRNKIGGSEVCIGTYLPSSDDFTSLEYDEDYKEIEISYYTKEAIQRYLDRHSMYPPISSELWDKDGFSICINTPEELENGDVGDEVPISVNEFLSTFEK